ncbi:ferredoxin [Streptomyces sp. 891-h]|uniref:ferredoxin n=1 Tax=unclassified Streptomyces TaxID=2593676 RepID=UPI001FAB2691|nr:ferredoxin [Streptomyces sp. 891-h]UNZ20474.1 ferredoxin [Streptomyces sp. 891-h]
MRISVDRGRCEGHGLCESVAPQLLRADEGYAEVLVDGTDGVDAQVPTAQESAARTAVRACPIAALRLR